MAGIDELLIRLSNRFEKSWYIGIVIFIWLVLYCRISWANPGLGVPYKVEFKGIEDDQLISAFKSVANTIILEKRYPATLNGLKRRSQNDIVRFYKVLKGKGYYSAKISLNLFKDEKPIRVAFLIDKGPLFILKGVEYRCLGKNDPKIRFPNVSALGFVLDEPVGSDKILQSKELVINALAANGHPYANVNSPIVIADFKNHVLIIRYEYEPGPVKYFGPVSIEGLQTVKEDFIRKKIPWKIGRRFSSDKIKSLRFNLSKSGLFTSVRITYADIPVAGERLPIRIVLQEDKHRTVRIGLSYKTDEGLGTKLSWEHRNLFQKGEQFKIETSLSDIETEIRTSFQKPDFLKRDQSLIHNFSIAAEHADAYDSKVIDTSLFIERNIGYGRRFSAGCAFELSQVEQSGQKDEFALLSFPSYYDWDLSDDLFDPRHGGHFLVKLAPFIDTIDTDLRFLKGSIGYSHYFELFESPLIIFGTNFTLGSMGGNSRDDIPANLRFYAGGGGTIRGYAYQTVGCLSDAEDNFEPIGGRSLTIINNEFRIRFSQDIGLVFFLDGGNVYEPVVPKFNEDLQWGYGIGFRYFTVVGPLRVDFGIPLNPRKVIDESDPLKPTKKIDESYHFYVSIGHAF